jgi:hypothetical protein
MLHREIKKHLNRRVLPITISHTTLSIQSYFYMTVQASLKLGIKMDNSSWISGGLQPNGSCVTLKP